MSRSLICHGIAGSIMVIALGARCLTAEPPSEASPQPAAPAQNSDVSLPVPPGMIRLDPKMSVWVDRKNRRVLVDGRVCLRQGALEVFACPKGYKEHESIVAVDAKPSVVHAALLAVGAKPGKPAVWQPEYKPASGDEIEVLVLWKDEKGKLHEAKGQEWVRNAGTKKQMEHPWVFAGSGFWKDDTTGEQHYMADAGEFICLSNFVGSMLDIPVPSSESNEGLLFEAFTERVPEIDTKIRLVLTPKSAPKEAAAAAKKGS